MPGLRAHPRDELREHERDHELPLLVGEVREVDDRRARRARRACAAARRCRAGRPAPQAANAGDATSPFRRSASAMRSFGGKNVSTSKHAELAHRRGLDLADQRREVEVAPCPPGVLDQVREQHELPARERVGLDADQPEQARHGALDLVAQRLRLGLPGERRRLQRADHVQRHAGVRAGRVDRRLGGVAQRADALRPDALRGQSRLPVRRGLRGELVGRDPRGARVVLADPRAEVGRREVGEGEQQVAHVALRVEDERRHAREERLLEQHDPEPRLAGARHADDHAVRGQVLGLDDGRAAGGIGEGPEEQLRHPASLCPVCGGV